MFLLEVAEKAFNDAISQLPLRPVRTLPCHRLPAHRSRIRCFFSHQIFSPTILPTFAQTASLKSERLPVTQEAAGSSPVAPANSSNRRRLCLSKRHRPNYFAFSVKHGTLRKASH